MYRYVFYAECDNGDYLGTFRSESLENAKELIFQALKDKHDVLIVKRHEILFLTKEPLRIEKIY